MFKCWTCGSVFTEPKSDLYESDKYGRDSFDSCPCCGNDTIEKVEMCSDCEEYFNESELRYISVTNKYNQHIEGFICEDCLYQMLEEIFE